MDTDFPKASRESEYLGGFEDSYDNDLQNIHIPYLESKTCWIGGCLYFYVGEDKPRYICKPWQTVKPSRQKNNNLMWFVYPVTLDRRVSCVALQKMRPHLFPWPCAVSTSHEDPSGSSHQRWTAHGYESPAFMISQSVNMGQKLHDSAVAEA